MDTQAADPETLKALARMAGFDLRAEDLDLLQRALAAYARGVAALEFLDLEGVDPPVSADPRVGW
jgi:hypothetical protein